LIREEQKAEKRARDSREKERERAKEVAVKEENKKGSDERKKGFFEENVAISEKIKIRYRYHINGQER
jgi:hypothetical protein